jgi:hypothetical protein
MRWLGLTGICAALSVGCAGVEPVVEGAGGSTGSSSVATTGSGPTETTSNGPPGACPHTTDRFSFQLTWTGGPTLGCGAETGSVIRQAMVTNADTATAELVSCLPGAGCAETFQLSVAAPDLAMPLIMGAFVQIQATVIATGEGCATSLIVANVPQIGGQPNPITVAPILWLAGADGTLFTAPDAPFHAVDAPGCGADSNPGFADDQIELTYSQAPAKAPATVSLPMGVSYVAKVPGGDTWLIRNLRSFHENGGPLQDTRDFAYWITHVTPELP